LVFSAQTLSAPQSRSNLGWSARSGDDYLSGTPLLISAPYYREMRVATSPNFLKFPKQKYFLGDGLKASVAVNFPNWL
jgi:hypothetical protein